MRGKAEIKSKKKSKQASDGLLDAERFPILGDMPDVLLHVLNQSASVLLISDDVEVLQQGDIPEDIYFIDEGLVSVVKKNGERQEELHRLGRGEVFGELGALRDRSRIASVYTLVQSRIIRVRAETVRQLMEIDAAFRDRLSDLMHRRLLATFLDTHPVFAGISKEARASLAGEMQLNVVPKGEVFFSKGSRLQGVYLVVCGEVEVVVGLPVDDGVVLEMRRDNEVLGELCDDAGRAAYSAVMSSEADVLHVDDAMMQTLNRHCPEVAQRIEALASEHAKSTQERIDQHHS